MKNPLIQKTDVTLVGAGIMSATLGIILKEIDPNVKIRIYEKLGKVSGESSSAWNNAGTGHAGFAELNYTPILADGSIDISKAVAVNQSFQKSLGFWDHLQKKGVLDTTRFFKKMPHISFVEGKENVEFLRQRHKQLTALPSFREMEFSDDPKILHQWIPLMMEGRNPNDCFAATRMEEGSDIDFGELTKQMFAHLSKQEGVEIHLNHEVKDLTLNENSGDWELMIKDIKAKDYCMISSGFVFLGAGGGSLPLLIKSGIPESRNYAGFPVSGKWLKCKNPHVIAKHFAKVYGIAETKEPPMSVPHLDTRIINGKRELLFGPFAGFTTKFLKEGSYLDLIKSVNPWNLKPIFTVGYYNFPLSKYLIRQSKLTKEEQLSALEKFFPNAYITDWEITKAGKRVQVIKKEEESGNGILEFGTELVISKDQSISALLGASPGASTAFDTMLNLTQICFSDKFINSSTNLFNETLEEIPRVC